MNNQFYYGFFDELEKVGFVTPNAQKLLGAVGGAGAGALSTRRKPGESSQDYAKRTALTSAAGGALGLGGVVGARKAMSKLKERSVAKTRAGYAKGVAGAVGLGSIGVALTGKKSNTGKAIKGAQNVFGSDLASSVIKGKASGMDILEGLGNSAMKNEKGIGAVFGNFGKRKQYRKAMDEFKVGGARTEKELKTFDQKLRKSLGMSGKTSSFGSDMNNLLSGNKVNMAKSRDQMNFDQVRTDVMKNLLGAGSAKSSTRFIGRRKDIAFSAKGSKLPARELEGRLNTALDRISNSDLLNSEQKTKMLADTRNVFQKRFKVNISDSGSMSGRTAGDRLRRVGSGILNKKNKYTISSKTPDSKRPFGNMFKGEKIAHVADDILTRHGYK